MDMQQASQRALQVRELYRQLEQRRYGREWNLGDLMVGFVGDVGDLAKLIGAAQGVRPADENLRSALEHELADCLWSVFVLADELDIDPVAAFASTMDFLEAKVTRKLAE